MCKYILIGIVVFLIVLMIVGAVVVQLYGWTGFMVMLGVMFFLALVLVKLTPRIVQYLLLRPIRRMGRALQGATIVVHSVRASDAPPRSEIDNVMEAIGDEHDCDDDEDEEEPPVPMDWYQAEITVVPPNPESAEGRIRHREGWSPSMIGVRYIRPGGKAEKLLQGNPTNFDFSDMTKTEHGDCLIWDGDDYTEPNESVFGEQRLRLYFGVAREVGEVDVVYTNFTPIGKLTIPRIQITPDAIS